MSDKPKSDDHDITDQIDEDRDKGTAEDEALRQTDGMRGSGGRGDAGGEDAEKDTSESQRAS